MQIRPSFFLLFLLAILMVYSLNITCMFLLFRRAEDSTFRTHSPFFCFFVFFVVLLLTRSTRLYHYLAVSTVLATLLFLLISDEYSVIFLCTFSTSYLRASSFLCSVFIAFICLFTEKNEVNSIFEVLKPRAKSRGPL